MDRDSVPLTLLITTLSFVVYTPFGCEIPCYRVTAFDRGGLDSGHAPAFFVGALNLLFIRLSVARFPATVLPLLIAVVWTQVMLPHFS